MATKTKAPTAPAAAAKPALLTAAPTQKEREENAKREAAELAAASMPALSRETDARPVKANPTSAPTEDDLVDQLEARKQARLQAARDEVDAVCKRHGVSLGARPVFTADGRVLASPIFYFPNG